MKSYMVRLLSDASSLALNYSFRIFVLENSLKKNNYRLFSTFCLSFSQRKIFIYIKNNPGDEIYLTEIVFDWLYIYIQILLRTYLFTREMKISEQNVT